MMVQAQILDSEVWVQILSLLLICCVLGEGPLPLPVTQFPHLLMSIIRVSASEAVERIRLVLNLEALGILVSTW